MKNKTSPELKFDSASRIPRPETLTHIAYERIKEFLVSGKLERDVIYPASQFAEILGVSRTPVREALLQLESEGYLDFITGRGFCLRKFTAAELKEFFEFRKIVEPVVLKHIVNDMSSEQIEKLFALVKKMEQSVDKDPDVFIQHDSEFHLLLMEKFGNRYMFSVMDNVRGLLAILGVKSVSISGRGNEVVQEHRKIVEAIANGDVDGAESAMLEHLESTEKNLLKNLFE